MTIGVAGHYAGTAASSHTTATTTSPMDGGDFGALPPGNGRAVSRRAHLLHRHRLEV